MEVDGKGALMPSRSVENLVARWFSQRIGADKCVRKKGKFKGWDLKFSREGRRLRTVEVKCDWHSAKSGNMAFEIWNTRQNEPSGLTATTADHWIHVLPGESKVCVYNPKTILWWLNANFDSPWHNIRKMESVGDGNSTIYIVGKDVILSRDWVSTYDFLLAPETEDG